MIASALADIAKNGYSTLRVCTTSKISLISLKAFTTFLTKNFSLFLNMRHMQMSLLKFMYFDQFLSKEINNSKRKKTERKTPEECHQISFFIKVSSWQS